MDEIRIGSIGSGFIVHNIMDHVQNTDGMRLVAVYSRSQETGEKLACKYRVSKVYTDIDLFLHDEEINFVYIASPNSLHYEQAKKALLAGKNVICEKPCCTSASYAKELIQLAREKNLIFVDAVPTAFLPNLEIIKRELPKIGRVKLVLCNYSKYSSRYDQVLAGEIPNVFNPQYAGGCLMDINFYNVYFTMSLFGKPNSYKYYPNIYGDLVDTSGIMIMQYDGFVGQCAGAKDTWGENAVQIQGEKGYMYISGGSNVISNVKVVTKDSEENYNEQEVNDYWYYEVKKLAELLLEENLEMIYRGQELMIDVMEVIENARKEAGILFSDEK